MALVTRTGSGMGADRPGGRWRRPLGRRVRRGPVACRASGWGVRLGATDGRGGMVCPVCEQTVGAPLAPELAPRVCIIDRHP